MRARPCASCAALWGDAGTGWQRIKDDRFAKDHEILATSDVDGDGAREAIVLARWVNDYGMVVLGNDWSTAAFSYSCGHI